MSLLHVSGRSGFPGLPAGAIPALAATFALAACGPVDPPAAGPEPTGGSAAGPSAAGPCLTDEPRLLHYARWLATDPDPRIDALRRRYEIEMVPAAEVVQVTDPVLCQQAGSAYRDALDLPEPPDAVAVIRVGDRYVVTSRVGGSTSREFASAVVFDDTLRVLSSWRG